MKKKSIDYWRTKVFQAIVDAQRASDAGKDIYYLPENWASLNGYSPKASRISYALHIIDTHPPMGIIYYSKFEKDQNGYNSIVVYFEWKDDNGRRQQVSFHNPLIPQTEVLEKWVDKGRPTRWNKRIGGSRGACSSLIQNGEVK